MTEGHKKQIIQEIDAEIRKGKLLGMKCDHQVWVDIVNEHIRPEWISD
jgi:hypothetical protein